MPEDKDHVLRPMIPWRPAGDAKTECGRPATGLQAIERAAFARKLRAEGEVRSAKTTCMTCWETASRWADWATSPCDVLQREIPTWHQGERSAQLNLELTALATLAEAHVQEFQELLQALRSTTDLATYRSKVARRGVHSRRL